MHTVRLKIDDKVYEKLIWLLGKFSKDEVEVIPEDLEFIENQLYLTEELKEITEGKAIFVDFDQVNERLENVINKHENNL